MEYEVALNAYEIVDIINGKRKTHNFGDGVIIHVVRQRLELAGAPTIEELLIENNKKKNEIR